MASEKCPRCYQGMGAQANDGPQHTIGRCNRDAMFQQHDNKFIQTWPAIELTGAKDDSPGDLQQCDYLLKNFKTMTDHNGKPVTKWMLEKAWKTVYPFKSGVNQAEAAQTQSAPSRSGPSGQPIQNLPLRPMPAAGSQPSSSRNVKPGGFQGPAWRISPHPDKHFSASTSDYKYAVHKDCALDMVLAGRLPSQHFYVAANYVAVSRTPLKVYIYGIEYGTVSSIKSEQQSEAEEGRKVGQRSEKARIFEVLGSRSPLCKIPWATDYEQLWTLQRIPDNDLNILRTRYAKLSGREYMLDIISFKYQHDLALGNTPAEGTRSLLDPDRHSITKKGGSLRTTALNALIARHVSSANSNINQVGPNKFFLKGYEKKNDLFNIHRGYYTSIRPGSDSILLNVNTATSAFYQTMTVAEFYRDVEKNPADYGDPEDLLKGLTVRIAYDRQKHDDEYDPNTEDHRHRIIAGFGDVPSVQKFDHNGVTKTVAKYFGELGAPKINHPAFPCVSINVTPKKAKPDHDTDKPAVNPNWVPPEFLQIDPYQAFNKLLQGKHTDDMITVALRHPAKNQDLIINEAFPLLGIGQRNAGFDQLQLSIGDKLIAVPARLLDAPVIMYRSNRGRPNQSDQLSAAKVEKASWNLVNVHFFQSPHGVLPKEVCTIDMRLDDHGDELKNIGHDLSMTMGRHGITFAHNSALKPGYVDLIAALEGYDDDESVINTLKQELQKIGSPNMLLVLLPPKDTAIYGQIKRVCDQWLGVHTVCLVAEKVNNRDGFYEPQKPGQLFSNLALKFNMKLRGQNHQICRPNTRKSAFEAITADTIVLGADVSHPSGGMAHSPSVAAVVGSDDANFANFPGSMRLQAGTQEMIADLEGMVYERLMRFYENRKFLPNRMIFYRDGVSEDQFAKCRTTEIPQIEKAFERARVQVKAGKLDLKLTFIVVGKRHHTRFFACREKDTYGDSRGQKMHASDGKLNGNLYPGLLVDQVVTRPAINGDETFDFFLQSHAALKGTARSAHYTVLLTGGLRAQTIQDLTHAFCYNYMRATKGVSYAGPAYYADRLCDRGNHYLRAYTAGRKTPDIEMSDEELNMPNKKEASMLFAKRVAQDISQSIAWNPRANERQNPWCKEFDNRMFWL